VLVPDAITALKPDLLVLTEYVRGISHDEFVSRLAESGLKYTLLSQEARGENSVMIASRRPMVLGQRTAPAISPSLPSNFLHVELPEDGLQVMGIRIPDYSRQPSVRRACWDWLCTLAEEVVNCPTVILGDFNADPDYPKSRCGDCFSRLAGNGWRLALPDQGASYWTLKHQAPCRLDHAFVSDNFEVVSTRYVDRIDSLILANRASYSLPDHAALEVVIEDARTYVFSACRTLLEMVQVLHQRGYERIRINPGMAPSGCYWRCGILPASMTVRGRSDIGYVEPARYSSGQGKKYFGWTDTISDSPETLATKFVERFLSLAREGFGRDPAYASWYSRMLKETAPDGFIYAFADYPVPKDHLPVQNKPGMEIPLPPPWSGSKSEGIPFSS
jgi:endonuclease/exonuclease/phosphatase family metal-dependent hydrolase